MASRDFASPSPRPLPGHRLRLAISPLKSLAPIAVLLMGLSAGGCISNAIRSAAVEATDLSSIQVGATRESVERVLGRPMRTVATDRGTIATYEYDRGAPGGGDGPWRWDGSSSGGAGHPGLVFALPVIEAVAIALETARRAERVADQKGTIDVIYGQGDTVIDRQWGGLPSRLHRGDAEAQDVLGNKIDDEAEQWKLLCVAASQGHQKAMFKIGGRFLTQKTPLASGRSTVEAYKWWRLSANRGDRDAARALSALASGMSSADKSEGERLARQWQPDAEQCIRGG